MSAKIHLALTGFMGVGKSEVGKGLLERGLPVYDVDDMVAATAGKTVKEVIETEGMHAFREREVATFLCSLELEPGAISTGGGIVTTPLGRNALKTCGARVVWLEAPFEVLKERVMADIKAEGGNKRPLFEDPVKARELFEERQEWYRETAQFRVDATQPITDVVAEVASLF